MRQVTGIAVLHDIGGTGALGQLGTLFVEDHRQVGERRHVCADGTVDIDLARRVVDVVIATHHIGDAHVDVVHDHGEVVGRVAVRAEDHQVVEFAVGDLDATLDLVFPHHRSVLRILQPDHAIGIFAPRLIALTVGAVVTRFPAGSHRCFAHRIKFCPRLVGVVGLALGHELLGHFAITLQPMGLVDRAFVVIQPQPGHRIQDGVDRRLGAALTVGVLDAQDEFAATAPGLQPAVQRGAGTADVQVTSGAGSKTGTTGHGRLDIPDAAILHCARPVAGLRLQSHP